MNDRKQIARTCRGRRREALHELHGLVLGGEPVPAATWVRDRELWPALVAYLRTGRTFRRQGLAAALRTIPPVSTDRPARSQVSGASVFCARSAGWRLLGLARTVAGRRLCLHESLGLCAALRTLGFPAQVVIGYPMIEPPDGREELHAWPALGAVPLTGRSASSRVAYDELFRYPEAAGERPPEPAVATSAGGGSCS